MLSVALESRHAFRIKIAGPARARISTPPIDARMDSD